MRNFTVQQGVRGYVVQIGCQVAGFSSKVDLLSAITEYIQNPEETEKKYYSNETTSSLAPTVGVGITERQPVVDDGSCQGGFYETR